MEIHFGHQAGILFKTMVVVAGGIAGVFLPDFSGLVRKHVPDGLTLAVSIPCSLDLVGGGRCSPGEIIRKSDGGRRMAHGGEKILRTVAAREGIPDAGYVIS